MVRKAMAHSTIVKLRWQTMKTKKFPTSTVRALLESVAGWCVYSQNCWMVSVIYKFKFLHNI